MKNLIINPGMTKHEAIKVILSDRKAYSKSLNYAVNYCREALHMTEGTDEFNVQCLYILENIRYWCHPQAKEVRATLKR